MSTREPIATRAQSNPFSSDVVFQPQAHHVPHDARVFCRACFSRSRCLPAELDGEDLANFERSVWRVPRPLKTGRTLVRQGNAVEGLYALRVGSVKAVVDGPRGTERVVDFRFPGAIIGLAQLDEARWQCSYIALEDCWLCHIPLHALTDTLRHQVVKIMSAALRQGYESHLTLAFKNNMQKVASFLVAISDNCRRRELAPHRFNLPMQYKDIASYLGMRHETVSRTLAKLQQLGLIERSGNRIHILDLGALRGVRGS